MKKATILKRVLYLPLAFLLALFMGFQCESESDEFNQDYDFEIGVEISPEQVTYKVGDTIRLKYQINQNTLHDTRTGTDILLGKSFIPFKIYFGKRASESGKEDLSNVFSVFVNNVPVDLIDIEENGQFSEVNYNLYCEILQGKFEVELLCIPQKVGIYKFDLRPIRSIYFSGNEDCSANVTASYYANLIYKFRVNKSNVELMAESPLPPNIIIMGDQTEARTNNNEIFWIKVED